MMNRYDMKPAYYAVRVRSQCEQKVVDFLSASYEVFHPTYRERRQWSDRVKDVDVPLFDGYIFCHMDIEQRLPVLQAPGVVDIVCFGSTFVPAADAEIAGLRKIVNSSLFARPCPYLSVGERVHVEQGPLKGLEGILLERKTDTLLVVSVHMLQRSIATQVKLEWVRPVTKTFGGLALNKSECQALGL